MAVRGAAPLLALLPEPSCSKVRLTSKMVKARSMAGDLRSAWLKWLSLQKSA
jgi:hypothetical protein